MRFHIVLSASILFAASGAAAQANRVIAADTAVDTENWASDIAEFRKADRLRFPPPGGVVFIGSSSIRMWPDLAHDFPGVNVIQRGFGGSQLADVVYRAPRLVVAYKPRLVVLYAGDNDLAYGRTPEQVLKEFQSFVAAVRGPLPRTKITFLAIKPSWARVALLDKMRATNELIRKYIEKHPGLIYVDTFTPMLSPAGRPRMELLDPTDSLHLNATGYKLWRNLLRPIVGPASSDSEPGRQEGHP